MIQYYSNLKPVPYGVARQVLGVVYPRQSLNQLNRVMACAFKREPWAIKSLSVAGLSVADVKK
jgi:hypothetical protein